MASILNVSTKREYKHTAKTKIILGKIFVEHITVFTINEYQKRE